MTMFHPFHQSLRSSLVAMAFYVLPALAALPAQAQSAAMGVAAGPVSCDPPDVVVLEVKGTVQASTDDGKTWAPATPGLHVTRGHWLRTGFRSSVTCGIAPDRAVTIESLNAIRVDPAMLNDKHCRANPSVKCANDGMAMAAQTVKDRISTPVRSKCDAEDQAPVLDEQTRIAVDGDASGGPETWKKALMGTFLAMVLAGALLHRIRYAVHVSFLGLGGLILVAVLA
jgi:hypothetical protein